MRAEWQRFHSRNQILEFHKVRKSPLYIEWIIRLAESFRSERAGRFSGTGYYTLSPVFHRISRALLLAVKTRCIHESRKPRIFGFTTEEEVWGILASPKVAMCAGWCCCFFA